MENVAKNSRKAVTTTTTNRGLLDMWRAAATAAAAVAALGDSILRIRRVVSRGLSAEGAASLISPCQLTFYRFVFFYFFGKVQRIRRQTTILLLYVYSYFFWLYFVSWPRRQQHNLPLALHQAQLSLARSQRRVAFPIPSRVSCCLCICCCFFLAISSRFRAFGVSYDLFDMTVKWTEIYFSMLRF